MKKVMDFLKARWVFVVLGVAVLVAMPLMLFFSSKMSGGVVKRLQDEVGGDWSKVSGATINYTIPTIVPGEPEVSKSFAPNEQMIEWFREKREVRTGQAKAVVEKALAFNKGEHGVLVSDLFPKPDALELATKPLEMAREYIEVAHKRLLEKANAGGPPEADVLARDLSELLEQKRATNVVEGADPASVAKANEEIAKELGEVRQQRYRDRSESVSVYADESVFLAVPSAVPAAPPSVIDCWDWQETYWVNADLVRAVTIANADSGGVPDAVVKRILSIDVDAPGWMRALRGGEAREGEEPTEEAAAGDGSPNFAVSVTGRTSGPGSGNDLYDIRTATMELIVSTQRLPQLFDALAKTNFISVLEVDVERLDPHEELRQGYYYGEEPVSRVTLRLETIWFREWTKEFMPKEIRSALGIPEDEKPEGSESAGGG